MQNNALEKNREQIREIKDLPPLSMVAEKILREINKEYADIAYLSSVIEQDPGLLARLIGIANSAYFGCPDRIYTVSDAIIKVLGLDMVKSLALGIVLSSPLHSTHCQGFKLERYWSTTMHTAHLARQLSPYIGLKGVHLEDNAYLCGILHNIGLLILINFFPRQMSKVFSKAGFKEPEKFHRLQLESIGITYMEAGSILAQKWHLPTEVGVVSEHHLDADYRGEHWEISALIGLSSSLVSHDYMGGDWDEESDRYISALQIESDVIRKVSTIVHAKKQDLNGIAKVLSLD